MLKIIDDALLERLTEQARKSPRLRSNFNIHDDYTEVCQRLLNAVEPGSYIRPHRHLDPSKPETFVALRGRFAALLFSDAGEVMEAVTFTPFHGTLGLDFPAGAWHSILSLEKGSIFFETKPGPYLPLSDKDWAPWAPEEGSREAGDYLRRLESLLKLNVP